MRIQTKILKSGRANTDDGRNILNGPISLTTSENSRYMTGNHDKGEQSDDQNGWHTDGGGSDPLHEAHEDHDGQQTLIAVDGQQSCGSRVEQDCKRLRAELEQMKAVSCLLTCNKLKTVH